MNQQTITVELVMLTDDIACYLTPLMARYEYQEMARKSARSKSFLFFLAMPVWAGISGLFTLNWKAVASSLITIPLALPFAFFYYRYYTELDPKRIVSYLFYTRLVGTTKITVGPQGVTLDKRYSDSKTTPWKKIKRIYRLKKCWYFVLSATSLKTLFIPLSALEMPEQDVLIRELCQTYWQGAIIES